METTANLTKIYCAGKRREAQEELRLLKEKGIEV